MGGGNLDLEMNPQKDIMTGLDVNHLSRIMTTPSLAFEFAAYYTLCMWKAQGTLTLPTPLPCLDCKGWRQHRVTNCTRTPRKIEFSYRCSVGHSRSFTIDVGPTITHGFNNSPSVVLKGQSPKSRPWQEINRLKFSKSKSAYLSPGAFFELGKKALAVPNNYLDKGVDPTKLDSITIAPLLERFSIPVFYRLQKTLDSALRNTALPRNLDLADLEWFHDYATIFLPEGSLITPEGNPCRFIAFSVFNPGIYTVMDLPAGYIAPTPRLHVWTMDSELQSYSFRLILQGLRVDVEFKYLISEHKRDFYLEILDRVLIYTLTARAEPSFLEQPATILRAHSKQATGSKKGRIHHVGEFRWPLALASTNKPSYPKTGYRMPPHAKPGWVQRYHRQKDGHPETFWRWRPPALINQEDQ